MRLPRRYAPRKALLRGYLIVIARSEALLQSSKNNKKIL
ncbi:hypothetical protein RFEPED_1272 [Rickettsia felis str. Pedreira]|uniref:Uncharacterized protein n=1 Tax=Rickettsia felis str. Pedreira TaxID=1359196 RepID=A0A0F3MSW6_RICFI|nr:hypothetical protein RFEPED_1272 [Rickettsia felis str. Pedreira]